MNRKSKELIVAVVLAIAPAAAVLVAIIANAVLADAAITAAGSLR